MILFKLKSTCIKVVLAYLESLVCCIGFRRQLLECTLKILVFRRQVALVLIDFDSELKGVLFDHSVYLSFSWQIGFKVFDFLVDEFVVFLES